ncbi:hypothetical protein Tco_0886039 [Tanacetum coccineum]
MIMASKSYEKHPAHKDLYDALIKSLFLDKDDMDKVVAAMEEPNEEHVHDMSLDAEENIIDEMGNTDEQPDRKAAPNTDNAPKYDWFKQPPRPPTQDLKWNKCQVMDDHLEQTWFNDLVSAQKDPLTCDELMATPIDFPKFAKNRLKLDKITKADLVGPIYNILKATCQSSIELEYNMEEYYKALADRLDWENPEGDRCPFDLSKRLPLKGRPGHLTVASKYFFNNDLEYLKSIDSERMYTTSIIKMKAARYDLVAGRQLYKFKEGDFVNLHLNDIKDMLLLVVQHKLFHLDGEVNVDLALWALYVSLGSSSKGKWFKDVQTRHAHKRRSCIMMDWIDKHMLERRILRNLERLVGVRKLKMDYKLMQRTI